MISAIELGGVLAACGGTGTALLARDPRTRYAAMGLGLLAALALIVGEVWDLERFADLRGQPGAVVLALLLAATALSATCATFVRAPAAFVVAVFVVIALRVPVQVGGETNYLLVPLYGVIAGGWLRGAWLLAKGRSGELQTESSPSAAEPAAARWLALAIAASLVVYALGSAWSEDAENAIRNVCFFLAPFAALLALLRDQRWYRKLAGRALAATVVMAVLFSVVAAYQYVNGSLTFNLDLRQANELHQYFRVNSLFRDPNVFGRYLVFALIAVGAWVAWSPRRSHAVAATIVAVGLLAALVVTYSLTSFAALIVGLALLVWFRLGGRGFAAAAGLGLAAVAVFVLAGSPGEGDVKRERDDLAETSSGRTDLISGGIEMFEDEPFIGQGSGAFTEGFRNVVAAEDQIEQPVSHTEPVQVAAEQGILGLIPYAALIFLALVAFLRPWPGSGPMRAGVAACFAALLVHTLGYAGFAIDPVTWALLALGLSLRE